MDEKKGCPHHKCPSRSGWCETTAPDASCVPFLLNNIRRLRYENEALASKNQELARIIANTLKNLTAKGWWEK